MHGAHPHGVRRVQVARLVLEHCGALRFNPGLSEHFFKRAALRLWAKRGMFDAVNSLEHIAEPPGGQYTPRVGLGAVRINDLATR